MRFGGRAPTLVKIVTLGVVLAALALISPPYATAHTTRIATDPAVDAVLDDAPTRVAATFNETLQPAFAAMTVVGPDRNTWSAGEPEVDGAVISVALAPLGPAGRYTANYRVTSADGHPVTGSWSFSVTRAGTGTPGPPPATPTAAAPGMDSGGIPAWVVLAGVGAVVIAAGALLGGRAWSARRRRPHSG